MKTIWVLMYITFVGTGQMQYIEVSNEAECNRLRTAILSNSGQVNAPERLQCQQVQQKK